MCGRHFDSQSSPGLRNLHPNQNGVDYFLGPSSGYLLAIIGWNNAPSAACSPVRHSCIKRIFTLMWVQGYLVVGQSTRNKSISTWSSLSIVIVCQSINVVCEKPEVAASPNSGAPQANLSTSSFALNQHQKLRKLYWICRQIIALGDRQRDLPRHTRQNSRGLFEGQHSTVGQSAAVEPTMDQKRGSADAWSATTDPEYEIGVAWALTDCRA